MLFPRGCLFIVDEHTQKFACSFDADQIQTHWDKVEF